MPEELVVALHNRISLGEHKDALREEVLAAGHPAEVFEGAYAEAERRYAAEQQTADPTPGPVTEVSVAGSTSVSSVQTADVGVSGGMPPPLKVQRYGLIGIGELLQQGWQRGLRYWQAMLQSILAMLALFAAGFTLMVLLGIYVASVVDTSSIDSVNDINPEMLMVMGTVGVLIALISFAAIIIGVTLIQVAYLRTLVLRQILASSFWYNLRWALRNWVGIAVAVSLMGVIVINGLFLLFIPGFIALIYLLFTNYVIADTGRSGTAALAQSTLLVRGHFWSVVGRFLVMTIAIGIATQVAITAVQIVGVATGDELGPFIGAVLSIPISIISSMWTAGCMVTLYESLKQLPHPQSTPERAASLMGLYRTIAGIAVGLIVLGGAFAIIALINLIQTSTEFIEGNEALPDMSIDIPLSAAVGLFDGGLNYERESEVDEPVLNATAPESSTDAVSSPTSDEERITQQVKTISEYLTQIPVAAAAYQSSRFTYEGMCASEAGVNTLLRYIYDNGAKSVKCHDGAYWFVTEVTLPYQDVRLCIDASGSIARLEADDTITTSCK